MFLITFIASASSTAGLCLVAHLSFTALLSCDRLMPYSRGKAPFQTGQVRSSLIYSILRTSGKGVGLRGGGEEGKMAPMSLHHPITQDALEKWSQAPENAGPRTRPVWAAQPKQTSEWDFPTCYSHTLQSGSQNYTFSSPVGWAVEGPVSKSVEHEWNWRVPLWAQVIGKPVCLLHPPLPLLLTWGSPAWGPWGSCVKVGGALIEGPVSLHHCLEGSCLLTEHTLVGPQWGSNEILPCWSHYPFWSW